MDGGPGNDWLDGGPDRDFLTGGPGKDIFFFNSPNSPSEAVDTIVDFRGGDDVLALSRSGFGLSPTSQPGVGLDVVYDFADMANGTPTLIVEGSTRRVVTVIER